MFLFASEMRRKLVQELWVQPNVYNSICNNFGSTAKGKENKFFYNHKLYGQCTNSSRLLRYPWFFLLCTSTSWPSVVAEKSQYCSAFINKQSNRTALPQTISKVHAKIISQISNERLLLIFDAKFVFSTSTFSLKTGTNELKILLLNVRLMNLRSFFHTWARGFDMEKWYIIL